MNKTLIIIGREFTTRVRKRSFLVLTLVVPILLAGFYAFLMWMLLKDDTQDRKIAVINQSVLETPFEQINNNTFEYLNTPVCLGMKTFGNQTLRELRNFSGNMTITP